MSYAMGFYSKVKTEESFRVGAYVFDIDLIHYGGWVGDKRIDSTGYEITISELPGGLAVSDIQNLVPSSQNLVPSFTLEQIESGACDNLNENNYSKAYLPYICPCVAEYKEAARLFRAKQAMQKALE